MGIWWLCWTTFIIRVLVWITLTHASMDLDYHPITLCLLCSQKPPKAYNVLRTFHSPSESISPVGSGFCFVVQAQLPNPLCVLSKTQPRLDDEYTCGRLDRLTAYYSGYWSLAIGYGLGCAAKPLFKPFASSPATSSVLMQMP